MLVGKRPDRCAGAGRDRCARGARLAEADRIRTYWPLKASRSWTGLPADVGGGLGSVKFGRHSHAVRTLSFCLSAYARVFPTSRRSGCHQPRPITRNHMISQSRFRRGIFFAGVSCLIVN